MKITVYAKVSFTQTLLVHSTLSEAIVYKQFTFEVTASREDDIPPSILKSSYKETSKQWKVMAH